MRSNRTGRLTGAKLIIQGLGLLGFCTGISCAAVAQQSEQSSTAGRPNPAYAVEGLALGELVQRDNPSYRAYHCSPSEQFAGFTWCTKTSTPRTSRGLVYSSSSILHSADGTIVYANKTLEPTFSSFADAREEIQQIAQKYGVQPRIIEMPHRSGFPDGVIAVWGDVVLQPVDPNSVSQLAVGKSPQLGFMIDFIADFQRSARNALPIYRIGGGAGSVWAASYGLPDRGTLRVVAVDALKFASSPDQPARIAQLSPPPDQTAIVAQSPPAPDQTAIIAQQPPAPDQTAIVTQPPPVPDDTAQPLSPPTDKENESQTNIAKLKLTISLLKAELATSTAKIGRLENQISDSCPNRREGLDGAQTGPRSWLARR
jgi:hypothetical protein